MQISHFEKVWALSLWMVQLLFGGRSHRRIGPLIGVQLLAIQNYPSLLKEREKERKREGKKRERESEGKNKNREWNES